MKMSGLSPVAHGAMVALRQFEKLHFVPKPVADELVALELAEPKAEALAITHKGRAWRPFDERAPEDGNQLDLPVIN